MTQEEVDKALTDLDETLQMMDTASEAIEALAKKAESMPNNYAGIKKLPLPSDVSAVWMERATKCFARFERATKRMS